MVKEEAYDIRWRPWEQRIALEEMWRSRNCGEMKRKRTTHHVKGNNNSTKRGKRTETRIKDCEGAGMVAKTHKLKKKPAMGQVKWKLTCTAPSATH